MQLLQELLSARAAGKYQGNATSLQVQNDEKVT
jgi:hypothetical protein